MYGHLFLAARRGAGRTTHQGGAAGRSHAFSLVFAAACQSNGVRLHVLRAKGCSASLSQPLGCFPTSPRPGFAYASSTMAAPSVTTAGRREGA